MPADSVGCVVSSLGTCRRSGGHGQPEPLRDLAHPHVNRCLAICYSVEGVVCEGRCEGKLKIKEEKINIVRIDQMENRSNMEDINLSESMITLYPKNIFKSLRKEKQPSRKMDKIFE